MRFRHRLTIAAPAQRLWNLTLDVGNWPRWTPTMSSLQPLDPPPLQVGSRVLIKQPGQPALVWTILQLEAPRLLSWETRMPWGMRMRGTHRIEDEPTGCRNHLELELSGPGSWLCGLLFAPGLWLALALENRGFRRAAQD